MPLTLFLKVCHDGVGGGNGLVCRETPLEEMMDSVRFRG